MDSRYHRADELTPAMKQAAETLAGRKLRAEEVLAVSIYEPHSAPALHERERLADELDQVLSEMDAARPSEVSDEESETALDQAAREVRYGRPE